MNRTILAAAIAAALTVGAMAQSAPKALPLDNLGLEHLDIIVPDPAASARFYSRIFKAPPCISSRCVTRCATSWCSAMCPPIGKSVTSPLAPPDSGSRRLATTACSRRSTTAPAWPARCRTAGFGVAAAGPTGMWPDPDKLELQLFQPPAGLVTAAVPSPLEVQRDGLLTPRGVDHVMLRVTEPRVAPYIGSMYGNAVERPRDKNGRVWLQLAGEHTPGPGRSGAGPDARRSPTTRSKSRRSIAAHSKKRLQELRRACCPPPTSPMSSASPTTTASLSKSESRISQPRESIDVEP